MNEEPQVTAGIGMCVLGEDQRARLCRENIARCIEFRANPPPVAPQASYTARPLVQPIAGLPRRYNQRDTERTQERSRLRAAEHQKQLTPAVRMTSSGPPPYPASSLLPT